jgi:hypothetical protein
VTKDGKVTGVEKGLVEITGTTHDGKKTICKVTVTDSAPVTPTPISLQIQYGDTRILAFPPSSGASFSSFDPLLTPDVITIDSTTSSVTAIGIGKETITAKTGTGTTVIYIIEVIPRSIDIAPKKWPFSDWLPFEKGIDADVAKLGKIDDLTFTSTTPEVRIIEDRSLAPYIYYTRINTDGDYTINIIKNTQTIGVYNIKGTVIGGSRSTHKNRKFRYTRKASSRKTRKH